MVSQLEREVEIHKWKVVEGFPQHLGGMYNIYVYVYYMGWDDDDDDDDDDGDDWWLMIDFRLEKLMKAFWFLEIFYSLLSISSSLVPDFCIWKSSPMET